MSRRSDAATALLLAGTFADPAGAFGLDDTTFPKVCTHSVGVQRQYCGALSKKANYQAASRCITSASIVTCRSARLFLQDVWLEAPARLDRAGLPEHDLRALSKDEIVLELLDAVRAENVLPGKVIVGDSSYGISGPLREGPTKRDLHYMLGVTGEMVVFTEEPRWQAPEPSTRRRPSCRRPRLEEDCAALLSLRQVAARTPLRKVIWREGTKGPMAGRFASLGQRLVFGPPEAVRVALVLFDDLAILQPMNLRTQAAHLPW